MSEVLINGKVLKLIKGDITELDVDAIVNAANRYLQMGGGVAGAIRRKGGKSIQEECDRIGPINVGEAAITGAGKLKAKYVIHAVGPRFGEGNEEKKLENAVLNSLKLATKHDISSIAFPAISTGIFGYPIEDASEVMLKAALSYLKGNEEYPKTVIFCLYSNSDFEVFKKSLEKLQNEVLK